MKRFLRSALVVAVVATGSWSVTGIARADIDDTTATNTQEGSNRASTGQRGGSTSGDAVGGQVAGVVSSGRTSVDARNASRDSTVESGEVTGSNTARSFTGLNSSEFTVIGSGSLAALQDVTNADCAVEIGCNIQDGNNRTTLTQTAAASTGDGVAGQVIGAVTAAGGSASIVAANTTTDSDVATGEAEVSNDSGAFTGLDSSFATAVGDVAATDVTDTDCAATIGCNVQDGNNRTTGRQSASANTGDGVAGQVIGAVSAGATSIDATNRSDGVSIETGSAEATNDSNAFTGLDASALKTIGSLDASVLDVGDTTCDATVGCHLQDGNNSTTLTQSATANSGDGVGGEVIGAVTSAGGSASIVAANTSTDSDVLTGEANAGNDANAFTGLVSAEITSVGSLVADVEQSDCAAAAGCNLQDGNNRTTGRQTASASTGDGVAGQVIGAVSAGATSIDATNRSDRVSVQTGDSDANNDAALFTGHNSNIVGVVGSLAAATDVTGTTCGVNFGCNLQDGNNGTTLGQTASATSGDGVAGEVIGAVTSAGGSASIVAANTSADSDVSTGNADAANDAAIFTGLNASVLTTVGDFALVEDVTDTDCATTPLEEGVPAPGIGCNIQHGSNRTTAGQTARASTGDGVAGQVLGVVSAGATSLDATNRSDNGSAETGDADAANDLASFVGLNAATATGIGDGTVTADVSNADCSSGIGCNIQDGNNRRTLGQSADASSGDAVAGQVSGVVTSAGGSASVVLANTSTGIDSSTGDSEFSNTDDGFVGLNSGDVFVGRGALLTLAL